MSRAGLLQGGCVLQHVRGTAAEQQPPIGTLLRVPHRRAEPQVRDVDDAGSRPAFSDTRCRRSTPSFRRAGVLSGMVWLFDPGYQASPNLTVRRSAGALSPPTQIGRCGLAAGFGSNITLSNFAYLPSSAGRGSSHNARHAVRYSSVTAPRLLERRRAKGVEFLPHPAGADTGDDPTTRQHVGGEEQLRRQHRGAMRHHHDRCQQLQPLRASREKRQCGDAIEAFARWCAGPDAVAVYG